MKIGQAYKFIDQYKIAVGTERDANNTVARLMGEL